MTSADAPDPLVGSVLFVCTGNVCRSPYAERLLRHFVPGMPVASAGIAALAGAPMDPAMAAELARQGASADCFRSRQVSAEDLRADLVLTMTRDQRAWLLDEHPALLHRVGLLGAVPALAERAGRGRPLTRRAVGAWVRGAFRAEDEIPDPYRQPPPAARRAADRLDATVDLLADLLAPGPAGAEPASRTPAPRGDR